MKTYLKIFIASFSLTFFGISCNNSNDDQLDSNTINNINSVDVNNYISRRANVACDIVLNDDNPYNFVGKVHNEILSTYLNEYSDNITDISIIIKRVDELGNKNSNFLDVKDTNYMIPSSDLIKNGALDFDNQFSNVISDLNISNNAKSKLSELINYFFSKTEQAKSPSFEDVDNYFISFEKEVLVNTNFDDNDRRVLLSSVSTARFSSCFWYNYFEVEHYDYALFDDSKPKRPWWAWLIVGASDVVGAAVGSIPATATAGVAGATIITTAVSASTTAYTLTNPNNK